VERREIDSTRFLAKIGHRIPGLNRIGKRLLSPEFIEAVEFLYQGNLNSVDVSGGIILIGIIIFFTTTFVLTTLIYALSAFVLSVTVGIMSGLIIFNNVVAKYRRHLIQTERLTPYVLEELATIFLTTGSIFEAIQYVSKGEFGSISDSFLKMIPPLNQGVAPEHLLMDFAITQPSITLRRGLLAFIQFVESSNTSLDTVISNAHENLQRKFERLTLQWESRMMVYSGMLVFLPIIFILGVAIRGMMYNPLILLLPVIQFGLSKILLKTLLPNKLILLGE
jgi:pilus assembly protein TadC